MGPPEHPTRFHNLVADPHVEVQDGPVRQDMVVHVAEGQEREQWWARAVAVFRDHADYAERTDREIPAFVARPA